MFLQSQQSAHTGAIEAGGKEAGGKEASGNGGKEAGEAGGKEAGGKEAGGKEAGSEVRVEEEYSNATEEAGGKGKDNAKGNDADKPDQRVSKSQIRRLDAQEWSALRSRIM